MYGGSDPDDPEFFGRFVRQAKVMDGDFYIGGDFKMEMDVSQKTLSLEIDREKVTIDKNIGDFQYSPIVILYQENDYPGFELTLL